MIPALTSIWCDRLLDAGIQEAVLDQEILPASLNVWRDDPALTSIWCDRPLDAGIQEAVLDQEILTTSLQNVGRDDPRIDVDLVRLRRLSLAQPVSGEAAGEFRLRTLLPTEARCGCQYAGQMSTNRCAPLRNLFEQPDFWAAHEIGIV
jgi:hypothetical protein